MHPSSLLRPDWKMGTMKPRRNWLLNGRRSRWTLWDRWSAPQEQGPSWDPLSSPPLVVTPTPCAGGDLPPHASSTDGKASFGFIQCPESWSHCLAFLMGERSWQRRPGPQLEFLCETERQRDVFEAPCGQEGSLPWGPATWKLSVGEVFQESSPQTSFAKNGLAIYIICLVGNQAKEILLINSQKWRILIIHLYYIKFGTFAKE